MMPLVVAHSLRAILRVALAYFILPFDIIPDSSSGPPTPTTRQDLLATISPMRRQITPVHREATRRARAEEERKPGSFRR